MQRNGFLASRNNILLTERPLPKKKTLRIKPTWLIITKNHHKKHNSAQSIALHSASYDARPVYCHPVQHKYNTSSRTSTELLHWNVQFLLFSYARTENQPPNLAGLLRNASGMWNTFAAPKNSVENPKIRRCNAPKRRGVPAPRKNHGKQPCR